MTRQDPTNDPRWDRLVYLAAGELPPEEAVALRHWVDADPERREALTQIEMIWRATDVSAELDAADGEAELRRIKAEAGGGGRLIARVGPTSRQAPSFDVASRRRVRLGSRVGVPLRVAAALAVVMAGGLLWRHRGLAPAAAPSVSRSVTMAEYRTAAGERLSLHLPDGTEVRLAPGGVLRRPSDYGLHGRLVQLEGEAYFAVARDSARPFVVSTGHAAVRVLGTRFAVRAYPDEPTADVMVAEGRVAVRPVPPSGKARPGSLSADSLILVARDRATVTADGELHLTRGVDVDQYLSWTEGRLVFEDTPLREVVRRLERWHGIEVRLAEPSLGDRRVTAMLRNETAAQAVDLMATVLRLTVSRSQGAYVLGTAER